MVCKLLWPSLIIISNIVNPSEAHMLALRCRRLCQFHFGWSSFLIFSSRNRGYVSQSTKTERLPTMSDGVRPFKHTGLVILRGVKLEFLLFLVQRVIRLSSISENLKRTATIIRQPASSTKSISRACEAEQDFFTASMSSTGGMYFRLISTG